MRVFLASPYHSGSHRQWAEGYAHASGHEVHLGTLPGSFWQWRLSGGFVDLAAAMSQLAESVGPPDVLLVTSLVDVAGLRGMLPRALRGVPIALFMHENQVTYPAVGRSRTERLYGLTTWTSLLAADSVGFNSDFHRGELMAALPGFLGEFPDERQHGRIEEVVAKSRIMPVGCDLTGFAAQPKDEPPLVVWNHRWDADKDPATFLRIMNQAVAGGVDLRLALLGERFVNQRSDHDAAVRALSDLIVVDGHVPRSEYLAVLSRSSVVVSTARQEFFGISVVEAMAAGAFPILPDRLVYRERVPPRWASRSLYRDETEAVSLIASVLQRPDWLDDAIGELVDSVQRFDWSQVAPAYDDWLASTAAS